MTVKKIFVRTQFPHNYDTNEAGDETGISTGDHGADQSFRDECDINVILKRFGLGYEIPPGIRLPQSGDFTGINNFHDAMNAMIEARENFAAWPAHIRAEFDNDPAKFHDFAVDPKNTQRMAELGLLSEQATERARIEREQEQRQADAEAAQRHAERTRQAAERQKEAAATQLPKD